MSPVRTADRCSAKNTGRLWGKWYAEPIHTLRILLRSARLLTINEILEFFKPWASRSSGIRAQTGALLALIGGNMPLKDSASAMLAPHTREWALSQMPHVPVSRPSLGGTDWRDKLQFHNGRCASRSGRGNANDSAVGPATPIQRECVRLFSKIDPSGLSASELSAILRTTAEELIRYVCRRGVVSLSALWSQLDQTEQLHLETAEKLILEYLPFYLGQVRPRGVPALTAQLHKIEDLRRLRIEYSDDPSQASEYQAQRLALGRLLKENGAVQSAVLEGLRTRLRDLEYQESSIAFEVFQNADDACVQAREMQTTHTGSRFVVLVDEEALSFLHWGRPINDVGPTGFDGRVRGYHRDLERMLTLAGSDKQEPLEAGHLVTGKFGLGFKSVLLACDRPEVASAGLEFEIRAGVLPHALEASRAARLRALLQHWSGPEVVPGTILRLPGAQHRTAVLEDFRRNAGCLCAFSSSIREISIEDASRPHKAVWEGRIVTGNASLEVGILQFGAEAMNVLRIQMD